MSNELQIQRITTLMQPEPKFYDLNQTPILPIAKLTATKHVFAQLKPE